MEERRHTDQTILSELAVLGGTVRSLQDSTKEFRDDMRNLKENHLAHIERSLSNASNDLEWLKRFFWLLAGGLTANLLASIANFV